MPGTVSKWLPDDLWERVHPLLPKPQRRRSRYPGRKPLHDRAVLTGIIFVLRTGIPWREMPAELGCGSGMTCLRRLKRWHRNGVFQKLYEVLLAELHGADKLDSKVHVLVDAKGIPLAIQVSGANTHDVTQVIPLVDGVPKVRGKKRQATTKTGQAARGSRR